MKMNHNKLTVSEAYREQKVTFNDIGASDSKTKAVLSDAFRRAGIQEDGRRIFTVSGETGTGKNILAQAIHNRARPNGEFVSVGPSDLPGGLSEACLFGHAKGAFTGADIARKGFVAEAEGGTLYLDDILEYGDSLQAKLLALVEHGEYRRVGETNMPRAKVLVILGIQGDPELAMESKRLRSDLYYRCNGNFHLPPLRARGADKLSLAKSFASQRLRKLGVHFEGFTPEAECAIVQSKWPGNLRELKNTIRNAAELADSGLITLEQLNIMPCEELATAPAALPDKRPSENFAPVGHSHSQEEHSHLSGNSLAAACALEGEEAAALAAGLPTFSIDKLIEYAIIHALEASFQNRRRAAKMLGMSEATLYRKLKNMGILKGE